MAESDKPLFERSHHPFFLKGALVSLSDSLIGFVPQVVLFQYNPTRLVRSLSFAEIQQGESVTGEAPDGGGSAEVTEDPLSQPWDPVETLTLELELDATDDLDNPRGLNVLATQIGVADRIAALELLTCPRESLALTSQINPLYGSDAAGRVPLVLFAWGPGRMVPVRITGMQVTERLFNQWLAPEHATVRVSMRVMTREQLSKLDDSLLSVQVAKTLYDIYIGTKEALAVANVANTVGDAADLISSIGNAL